MSTTPAPIPPESRDWLFVLDSGCDECGWRPPPPEEVVDVLELAVPRWEAVLARPTVSRRPEPTTWSAVEYACHVRDMVRLLGERAHMMLTMDDPEFRDWDGDAKATELGYHYAVPAEVAADLARCTRDTTAVLDSVGHLQWDRPGHRSDGVPFTVASLSQYIAHEVHHHLHDVDG